MLMTFEEEKGEFVVCYHSLYYLLPDVGLSQINREKSRACAHVITNWLASNS